MVAVATPNSTTVSNAGRVGTKTLTSSTTSTQLDNNHHHHTIIVRSDSKNSSDDNDVLFDRKIEIASEGLISCYYRCFYKMPLKKCSDFSCLRHIHEIRNKSIKQLQKRSHPKTI